MMPLRLSRPGDRSPSSFPVEVTAEVLERARHGDPAAFEQLYRAHAPRVYALCLRLAADTTEADECAQDVFVRIWRSLPGYRGESALTTWIHRIAINTALERQRATRRRTSRVDSEDALVLDARPSRGDGTDARIDLAAALTRLGDTQRTVFVLREIEGYGFDEISEMTGILESTLRSHLFRARATLAHLLRG